MPEADGLHKSVVPVHWGTESSNGAKREIFLGYVHSLEKKHNPGTYTFLPANKGKAKMPKEAGLLESMVRNVGGFVKTTGNHKRYLKMNTANGEKGLSNLVFNKNSSGGRVYPLPI